MKKQRFAGQKNKNRNTYVSFRVKAQSAMEYLMTYGWAILIIAIVLVALFSLGVFNSANFTPRAQPGSCEVFRTSAQISLEGQCNGMLPEYVAQFNGQSSYVEAIHSGSLLTNNFTVSAWIYPTANLNKRMTIADIDYAPSNFYDNFVFAIDNNNNMEEDFWIAVQTGTFSWSWVGGACSPNNAFQLNHWYLVSARYNGTAITCYINGVPASPVAATGSVGNPSGPIYIGADGSSNEFFQGNIADAQLYNKSLSMQNIQALYQEGIGGAPIDLQHLVGWWPLNGNANDYSGNGNNAVPNGVTYTSSWTSSYTAP